MQVSFRHQLFQPAVLFLELLEALRVMDIHARVFSLPTVERLLADLVLAANFRRALGSLTLAKDLHYLFGIVSFLLHRLVIECYQTNVLTGPNSRSHPKTMISKPA